MGFFRMISKPPYFTRNCRIFLPAKQIFKGNAVLNRLKIRYTIISITSSERIPDEA
jgi:hypothetical protein